MCIVLNIKLASFEVDTALNGQPVQLPASVKHGVVVVSEHRQRFIQPVKTNWDEILDSSSS